MYKSEIFFHDIEGVDSTCITLGGKNTELPSYMMQGEKKCGYIYKEGKLERWLWKGFTLVENKRCLYFDKIDIFSFWEIMDKRRDQGLYLVRELAKALLSLDDKFLDLSSGILPLWRIYGINGGGILIFPQSLCDLIASCANENDRYSNLACWVHHNIQPSFSLCDQMVQLLYSAASSFPPFADANTREDGFRPIPLAYLQTTLDDRMVSFIDGTLRMGLTQQRDIGGNGPSQKALTWFLEQTKTLQWPGILHSDSEGELLHGFIQGQKKRAGRRIFWRKKGWIVISILVAVTTVGYFTGTRIKLALTPPYTTGMSDQQIIEEYYTGQNELDIQKMDASLDKHVKSPSELEVTNLFVTRQTRMAYETINTINRADEWVASGEPAIMEGTNVYGVADLSIKQVDTGVYDASSTIYSPYAYEENSEEKKASEGHVLVYQYTQTQRFTFITDKHGWRLIHKIENMSYAFVQCKEIPTYPNTKTILSQKRETDQDQSTSQR
ncbi:MAG: hypothetical protein WCR02_00795 [Sphaerochaetaceae bacterium]